MLTIKLQKLTCTSLIKKNIKEYKAVWWWSFRNKTQGGLRLTDQALEFIEEHAKIKTYKIEFPKEFAFTPQVLLWLDNYIDSPFFVNKKHIFLKHRHYNF